MKLADLHKKIDQVVIDPSWNRVFKEASNGDKGEAQWDFNIKAMKTDMKRNQSTLGGWSESYGLWPGQVWAWFAGNSRWIYLNTNTLPFYNVFPRLQGQFPSNEFNYFGYEQSSENHWLHNTKNKTD